MRHSNFFSKILSFQMLVFRNPRQRLQLHNQYALFLLFFKFRFRKNVFKQIVIQQKKFIVRRELSAAESFRWRRPRRPRPTARPSVSASSSRTCSRTRKIIMSNIKRKKEYVFRTRRLGNLETSKIRYK